MQKSAFTLYTELVGAVDLELRTRKNGLLFSFAGEQWATAPDRCKTEDGKFYIETWIAKKNIVKWKAEFVRGTGYNRMQPVSEGLRNAVDKAAELMQQSNILMQQAMAILKGQQDAELEEAAAKIVQTLTPR